MLVSIVWVLDGNILGETIPPPKGGVKVLHVASYHVIG